MQPLQILAKLLDSNTSEVIYINDRLAAGSNNCPTDHHSPQQSLATEALNQATNAIKQCPDEKQQLFKWQGKNYLFQFNTFNHKGKSCLLLCTGFETGSTDSEGSQLNPVLLSTLTDAVPDMLWAKDINGHYLFANQAVCEQMLLTSKSEVIGQDDLSLASIERAKHPGNKKWQTFAEQCIESDKEVLEQQQPLRFTASGYVKGHKAYLDIYKEPFYDENGLLSGTIGAARDITHQKLIEEELQSTSETFKSLLDASLASLIIFNQQQRSIMANQTSRDLTGYSATDILNKDLLDFIHPDDHQLIQSKLKQTDTGIFQTRFLTANNATRTCMVHAQDMPLFKQKAQVLSLVDITELQRKRQQLEEAQRIAHMGNYEWNLSDHSIHASDETYRIYGLKPNSKPLSFKTLLKLVHPDDKFRILHYLLKNRKSKQKLSISHRLILADGTTKYVTQTGVANLNQQQHPISLIGTITDISAQVAAQHKIEAQRQYLEQLVHYDNLTNLPNRTLFNDRLTHLTQTGTRTNHKLALLFIDLDNFKQINDSFGHKVGDQVILEVASRLKATLRQSDTISRLGGDEFALILENIQNLALVTDIIKKLQAALYEPIQFNDQTLYITLSIGATLFPTDGVQAEELLKNADAAMYKAKENGRNTYCFYDEQMTKNAIERVEMEANLRQALHNEDFAVYYQPQYNGQTHTLIGMEALVRWPHKEQGIIPPLKFLPLAEEIGLMVELDQWVIKTAMTQFAEWLSQGLNPGRLALNVNMKLLQHPNFIPYVQQLIKELNYPPHHLEFEVTEGQIMNDPEQAIKTLNQLKELDITISVDDFGTGYSSLAYLKRLPIGKLKIDQSFIRDLPHDDEDATLTRTIIGLAQNLNLDLIAEGVETKAQHAFVTENGCNNIQGYFYSQPRPEDEISELLQQSSD